jgi:hypothetical protein
MVQPTETITRPEPGLARGKWEAPAWAFWAMLGILLAISTMYILRRVGILRLGSKGSPEGSKAHGGAGTGTRPKA